MENNKILCILIISIAINIISYKNANAGVEKEALKIKVAQTLIATEQSERTSCRYVAQWEWRDDWGDDYVPSPKERNWRRFVFPANEGDPDPPPDHPACDYARRMPIPERDGNSFDKTDQRKEFPCKVADSELVKNNNIIIRKIEKTTTVPSAKKPAIENKTDSKSNYPERIKRMGFVSVKEFQCQDGSLDIDNIIGPKTKVRIDKAWNNKIKARPGQNCIAAKNRPAKIVRDTGRYSGPYTDEQIAEMNKDLDERVAIVTKAEIKKIEAVKVRPVEIKAIAVLQSQNEDFISYLFYNKYLLYVVFGIIFSLFFGLICKLIYNRNRESDFHFGK